MRSAIAEKIIYKVLLASTLHFMIIMKGNSQTPFFPCNNSSFNIIFTKHITDTSCIYFVQVFNGVPPYTVTVGTQTFTLNTSGSSFSSHCNRLSRVQDAAGCTVCINSNGPFICESIQTSPINGPFCANGEQISVSFIANGTFQQNNIFTAQLSNSSGSFSFPVTIGSLAGTSSGTIVATIPTNTASGTGYRIRIVSDNPTINGSDNGTDITISPEFCNPENVIKDIKINPIIGKLDSILLEGVIVEARPTNDPNTITEVVTTNESGEFKFNNLDPNIFYNLKFFYQTNEGFINNIYSEIIYSGYKLGDSIGIINMPYSMLLQVKQILKSIQEPQPIKYEIQYPLDSFLLSEIIERNRITYNLENINSLINQWRSFEHFNNQTSSDIIDNLGRIFIAMFANDELSKDSYQLAKEPPKALAEFVMFLMELVEIAQEIKSFILRNDELEELLEAPTKNDLIKSLVNNLKSIIIEKYSEITKMILETQVEAGIKESMNKWIDRIKKGLMAIVAENIISGVKNLTGSELKSIAKDLLNNEGFVFLYEKYIEETQHLIDNTYTKASLLVPPDGSFEEAANKVIVDNEVSVVSIAHQKTEEILFADSLLFNNAEKADLVKSMSELLQSIGILSEANVRGVKLKDFAKALKQFLRIFDIFKLVNYGGALYLSTNRIFESSLEQANANTLAFSPNASGNKPLTEKNKYQNGYVQNNSISARSQSSADLFNQVEIYNNRLDSILLLIENHQNIRALNKTIQLAKTDSLLDQVLTTAKKRIEAYSSIAIDSIPGFDSIYIDFLHSYHNCSFPRKGIPTYMAAWIMDTAALGFLDTLRQAFDLVKDYNNQIAESVGLIDSLIENIYLSKRIMITNISGPTEVHLNSTNTITITYKNFGEELVDSAYIKLHTNNGFSVSPDSLFIGSIPPGGTGTLQFDITSPIVDTFCFYPITLKSSNAEGDHSSSYIISLHCSKFLPFSSLTAWYNRPVCAGQNINLSSSTILGANYTWSGPNNFSSNNQNPIIRNAQLSHIGLYTVTASTNTCSSSDTVQVTIPSSVNPGAIEGPSQAVCKNSIHNFTVPPQQGVQFVWSPPANSTILSGQNTNSVTIKFSAQFTSGILSVIAVNNCGPGSPSQITIISSPETPGNIQGPTSVCKQSFYSYSISPVAGATSYDWRGPGGSQISGDGTTSVCIRFGNNPGGIVKVRAFNSCGYSEYQTLGVTASNCSGPNSCTSAPVANRKAEEENKPEFQDVNSLGVIAIPNPTENYFTIVVNSNSNEMIEIRIIDIAGREISRFRKNIGEMIRFGDNLKVGVYVAEIIQGNRRKIIKLVKQ